MRKDFCDALELRASLATQLLNYDLKVFAVMFGLAAGYAAVSKLGCDWAIELVEAALALGGFQLAVAWSARRETFLTLDDAVRAEVEANIAVARAEGRTGEPPDEAFALVARPLEEQLEENIIGRLQRSVLNSRGRFAILIFAVLAVYAVISLMSFDPQACP